MGFHEMEQIGKRLFEQFPVIKKSAKRVYQLASVALSKEKFKSEGDIVRISPDDGFEYFYGYYDKSPWDITDRYIIAVKVKKTYESVAPKEMGVVGVIDTKDRNKYIEIGTTHSWNVQQSCMAQWMGPDFKTKIIYNDCREGKYCSVIYNFTEQKEEKVLPMAAYDVARDGSFFLSLDFNRLHRMRPGYGYSNFIDETKDELCPDKGCIWKVDIETGKVEELFKYTQLADFEPDESMLGAEHKVNHLMISPNGKRFMVLHRWFQKGRKHTRLLTINVDKTEIYNLSDDVFVSHCYWKNDDEILAFLRKKKTGDHYYLMKDKTQEYKMFWPELNTDGHCSYSPNGRYIITDTYPNRERIAAIYLCTEEDDRSRRVARVFSPFKYDNDCRCDLHPRWNRKGDKVCIDSVHEGRRGLYIIDLGDKINCIEEAKQEFPVDEYDKLISFIIPAYNSENTINRCLQSLINQTSRNWEAVVINDGSTDETDKILKNYMDDKRFLIISQANSGPGIARNNGINHAQGAYISFLDSDDYLDNTFVEKVKERVKKTNADIVFYETLYEGEDGYQIKKSGIYNYATDNKKDFIVRQMSGTFSWGATKVVKRTLIQKSNAKFVGSAVGEESLFTFVLLNASSRIEFVKEPLYHYIQSDKGQHKKGSIDPIHEALNDFKNYLLDNKLNEIYATALINMSYKALSMSLYRCAINYNFYTARKKMKEKLKEYKDEYDFSLVEKSKLNRSSKLLLPFIKKNMIFFIYLASIIRNNTN